MLLRAIVRSSSKIYTARTATSSLYRCSSLRPFCGAAENNKSNKETSDLKSANANEATFAAKEARFQAGQHASDLERVFRDLSLRSTNLIQSKSRLDKAIESSDNEQLLAAIQDVEQLLAAEYLPFKRKYYSFPTELTANILQEFGGKPSAWMGRYLLVYQLKMLWYHLNPRDVSDHAAHLTLARAFVTTLVLGLFIYL